MSSSVTAPDMATSHKIFGSSDFVNQSTKSASTNGAFTNLLCLLHSWIWSKMWVAVFYQSEVKSSVPISYRIGSWKCVKKAMANDWKSKNDVDGSSMNHLATLPVSVLGNSRSLIESSKNYLEAHHRWYVVIWLARSTPFFPSNLGISVGILTGTGGQAKWCLMGSFVSFDRSGNSTVARNGSFNGANGFWVF